MIKIHGKDYVEVWERVEKFRGDFKEWGLETEIIKQEGKLIIMRAIVKDDKGNIRSMGTAYEVQKEKGINLTSHIENCETSAIGRALGFMNIGINGSIASADEVSNAISSQNEANVNKAFVDDVNPLMVRVNAVIDELKKNPANEQKLQWLLVNRSTITEEKLNSIECDIYGDKNE